MKEITDQEFDVVVLQSKGLVLVDFWAEWCGPCLQMMEILKEVEQKFPEMQIVKIDIESNQKIPADYKVRSIPTLILFNDGVQVATRVGVTYADNLIDWAKGFK